MTAIHDESSKSFLTVIASCLSSCVNVEQWFKIIGVYGFLNG